MLIIFGDNPDRIHSEAAFAKLCGACPIPASSGMTTGRHRLYRGGHRQANAALYRSAIVRMRFHQPTIDYVARRTADGMPKREIIRCVKRYLAREVYQRVMTDHRARQALEKPPEANVLTYRGVNAAMETFWARLKVEIAWIRGSIWFETRADAHAYLFEFIEVFYNRQRQQTGLGHLTPAEYADKWRRDHEGLDLSQPRVQETGSRSIPTGESMTKAVDLHRQYEEALNAADLDTMANLFDPQAQMHLPDGAVVIGRAAIREVYAALFAQSTSIRLTTRFATEVADLALLSCSWEAVSGGQRMAAITAEVAKRQPDGSWAFLIDNPWAMPSE